MLKIRIFNHDTSQVEQGLSWLFWAQYDNIMFINAMVTQGARSLAGMIFAPQASHLNVSLREDFNSLCLQTPHSIYDQS